MSLIPTRMEDVFKSNPQMVPAITPYIQRFETRLFFTVILADTNPHIITQTSLPIELMVIIARNNNAGTVNIWNETIAANVGFPLNAGDTFTQAVDNTAYDVAQALCMVLEKPNHLARRAIDSSRWRLIASAATQTVDVMLGLGPQQ